MRSLLDCSTSGGISSLGHNIGASLLSHITGVGTGSLAHSRSSYLVSTRLRTSIAFKIHAFALMTLSVRTLHTHNSASPTPKVPLSPDLLSVSNASPNGTHPRLCENEASSHHSPFPKSEANTSYGSGLAAHQRGAIQPSKDAPYTPSEVCAFLLLLLPESTAGVQTISVKEALHQLPGEMQEMVLQHPGGLVRYVQDHFSQSIRVSADGTAFHRVPKLAQSKTSNDQSALPKAVKKEVSLSPPPPPRPSATFSEPQPLFFDRPPRPAAVFETPSSNPPTDTETATRRFRNNIEILDALVEYIPTFFVHAEAIASTLPPELQALYSGTSFVYFLKRFKHYLDIRTAFGSTKIKLKEDFLHPKRGTADARYTTGNDSSRGVESPRSPPRNSEANLLLRLLPRVPKEFKSFAEVLQEISDIVSRHPAFDPRLGVMGFLEKYPEYFQVAEGKLRVRPYSVAPNALDELDISSSPFPATFAKLMEPVDFMAEGKTYDDDSSRVSASVPTSKLYGMLTDGERNNIRAVCRSFPRFLRLHGKSIVVSPDNMRVYKFKPEYERCAETLLNAHTSGMEVSPDDPVLLIPETMDENTKADWVFRELYNALPLMQCAELEDVLVLVPDAVREALPQDMNELMSMLSEFPDYFDTWPYPDDTSVIIIQRAKVGIPVYEKEEIIKSVLPLIPQGGLNLSSLRSRVPLPLQRYFYRYGVSKTLGEMDQIFRISGNCIIRIA
ncbi:unnamed protein product [Phytomonas sp. EM1]|nr:unnamed protein product [Phytomonas sp. EM1]|eukprot:CCW62324.1 unnamed protein product [Phytomonas sp. isolate EM1]